MVQILLVEDDDAIRRGLTRALTELGNVVTAVGTGSAALASVREHSPDVILLDLGLPDLDGSDVLAVVRTMSAVPVIVATARDEDREVIRLLDAGADDYIIKPFSAAQIDARIRAVLRRASPVAGEDPSITVGGMHIDPRSRAVTLDGVELALTRKEFDLLHVLAQHRGEVLTKRQLLAEVWQLPWGGADRTVDVHVSWLRRKLGETAAQPRYLVSIRGVGIKLVEPREVV
ncbi:response regulator transcription factor [soil metagenome]